MATLFQIAANFFARWIDPHSYPISFCGQAHHIDGVRAPQAGNRLSTVGPTLPAKRVIRYSPLTTSSPLGRGGSLSIRGRRLDLDQRRRCFPQAANLESKWRGTGCALVNRSVKSQPLSCLFGFSIFAMQIFSRIDEKFGSAHSLVSACSTSCVVRD